MANGRETYGQAIEKEIARQAEKVRKGLTTGLSVVPYAQALTGQVSSLPYWGMRGISEANKFFQQETAESKARRLAQEKQSYQNILNKTQNMPYSSITDMNLIRTGMPSPGRGGVPTTGGGTGGDGTGMSTLDSLFAARLKAITDQLNAARQGSLSALEQQRAGVAPLFEQQRAGLQTTAAQQARNFAEYMANRGLARSGESAQGRLTQSAALQGGMGQLKAQEAAILSDIDREKARIETDYQNKLAQAKTQNQIEKLTQKYNEQQQALAQATQAVTPTYRKDSDIVSMLKPYIDTQDRESLIRALKNLDDADLISPGLLQQYIATYGLTQEELQ